MKIPGITKILKLRILVTAGIIALLCGSCLDPFPLPELREGLLIVEAIFTNESEANRVALSFAGRDNESSTPVTGATVSVEDNFGNVGHFIQSEDGIYLPEDSDYPGVPGRKYVLHFVFNNGKHYRSDTCLFRDVPPIDNLKWELKQKPSPDNTDWLNGLEFKVDAFDPDNQVKYYHWTYEEVWESRIPFPIMDVYLGNNQVQRTNNRWNCYLSARSNEIMIKSTVDQGESLIQDHPLIFVSNVSSRLWRKYRIEVRQFALSEEAYFYHENLQEMTGQNGTIFDKQPFTLRGNIRSVENPEEIVMGYFLASGVSTSSVTIQTTGLPPEYRAKNEEFAKCVREARRINANLNSNMNQIFTRIVPRLGQIFTNRIYEVNEITAEEEFVGLQFAPEECTTCQGTGERPENW